MSVGEKVTYVDRKGNIEYGIIKSIAGDGDFFVVYNCGGEWEHYEDYTAAKTSRFDLIPGWV